jgi:hypothetical protein
MKKLFVFLMVVGLVMTGSGKALALPQTTYELYATVKPGTVLDVTDFRLRYFDLDGDQKCSPDEILSFSGVTFDSVTYTEILEVPSNNFDSPFTDGGTSNVFYWYFNKPSDVITTVFIIPNIWTYSQVPVSRIISVSKPGITVVQDPDNDLLLRRCDPTYPGIPCSLPPSAPLNLPGYFDIKTARITQIGTGLVDLSINLYEPIPAEPPYGFVSYIWQFAGGCVTGEPGDKDAINVVWNEGTWSAFWVKIKKCSPREIEIDPDTPVTFQFTDNGVKVRVPLADLLTAIDATGTLRWHAAVRRIPFLYHPEGYPEFPNTAAADYAPDVTEFLDCGLPPTPPCAWKPDDPARWEPRH